jgi:hypothetical protein
VEKVIRDYIPKRRNIVINQFRSSSNRLFPLVMPPLLQSEDMPLSKAKKITMSNPNLTEGDIWFTVDGSDPRMTGGRVNGRKYAGAIQVDKNTLLKARFKSKNTGEWIALAEEMFLLDASISEELVITEIMYHPDDDYPEFIELMNNSDEPVFLKGISFTKGISWTFTDNGLLQPGKGLVLTGDTSLFYKVYGYHAYGQFSKKLSNEGETIILKNSFNLVIDSVSYSSASPWPVIPGDGYSIGLKDIISDNSLAENWKVSEKKYGTPFRPDVSQQWDAMIYPNPVRNYATISLGESELSFSKFRIEIFNHAGIKVKSSDVESYNSEINISMAEMSDGFHYIRVIPENPKFEVIVIKVLKLR